MQNNYSESYALAVLESLKICKPETDCNGCIAQSKRNHGCINVLIETAYEIWSQQIDKKQCAIDTLLRLLDESKANG